MTIKDIKSALGVYASMFEIPKGCKSLDEVKPKSDLATFTINCGANCPQYTLKTRFGYSVLEMLDKGGIELYVEYGYILFGATGTLEVGDETLIVDNDNYNKIRTSSFTVRQVIKSRKEWESHLREKGYQVFPPRPFAKASGMVSSFTIGSIKGVMSLSSVLPAKVA